MPTCKVCLEDNKIAEGVAIGMLVLAVLLVGLVAYLAGVSRGTAAPSTMKSMPTLGVYRWALCSCCQSNKEGVYTDLAGQSATAHPRQYGAGASSQT